ncbi:rhodanese-like domain-containing protein [Mycolicibacterium novocastrense]|nr:rhodanese-like domain-containing protein [Mycolicibacterium novocastrense]
MAKTAKELVEAANAVVPKISHDEAKDLIAKGALVVDVRDAPRTGQERQGGGRRPRSPWHARVPRRPESPYHDQNFSKDKPVIVYCASGGRSALSGQALKELGYQEVYNLGAFGEWADSGGAVEQSGSENT